MRLRLSWTPSNRSHVCVSIECSFIGSCPLVSFIPKCRVSLRRVWLQSTSANKRCRVVRNLVLPLCGDKGTQIKLEGNGIRIPALFRKAVLPVVWLRPAIGFIRSVEFLRRGGEWFASICYNVQKESPFHSTGNVGVDRNSVGAVATLADPQNGKVEVDSAYTSQECSRCHQLSKPNGKLFRCGYCGHNDHRDANAAFTLSERVSPIGGVARESECLRSALLVEPFLGTEVQQCA